MCMKRIIFGSLLIGIITIFGVLNIGSYNLVGLLAYFVFWYGILGYLVFTGIRAQRKVK
jgi:hypothetical protein